MQALKPRSHCDWALSIYVDGQFRATSRDREVGDAYIQISNSISNTKVYSVYCFINKCDILDPSCRILFPGNKYPHIHFMHVYTAFLVWSAQEFPICTLLVQLAYMLVHWCS